MLLSCRHDTTTAEGGTGMSSGWNTPDQGGQGRQSMQDDQRRRQAALRSLADQTGQRSQTSGASGASAQADTQPRLRRAANQPGKRAPQVRRSTVLAQRPRRRRNPLPVFVIVVCVVALAAGAGVWALKSGQLRLSGGAASRPTMPAVRSIDLSAYNLSCPMQPVWSPDGTQIAVSATLGDCSNQYTGGKALAIFDAYTGKLTDSYTLNTILTKQGLPTGPDLSPAIWTPDGSALVFAYGYNAYQIPPPGSKRGLLSVTLATGATRFVADPSPTTPSPGSQGETLIWDFTAGTLAHAVTELTPATAYTWGADGSLIPGPAGAAGKSVVSVWRSGIISPIFAQDWKNNTPPPADQIAPQIYVYTSIAPSWSPGGHYLALPLAMGVRLLGGPDAYPTVGCGAGFALVCQSAPVPAPDKGFSAALTAFEAGWSPSPQQQPLWNNQDIAWRVDGQELATMLPGQDFNTNKPTATVTIFNTHTGAVVKTLTISRVVVNLSSSSEMPQITWSPRGASLAALNYADATLALWRAE